MARFKLAVEFVGTRYSGWQIQKNARTVQGEIAAVVRRISGRTDFELYGAGRTDAGVHALGQVAHLDLETKLTPPALRRALNDELPADVHVLSVEKVPRRFHARHDAVARSYLYQISRRRTAFGKPFVWWIKDALDVEKMRAAAARFVGLHDFRAFTDDDPDRRSTRVLVDRVDVAEEGALILVRMRGSHFLWKMVRRVVGVLAQVGRGDMTVAAAAGLLGKASDVPARLTAPPSGLFLERVFYAEGEADPPLRAVMRMELDGTS
jgi:tRNA pseudouridine38-40 synthase